ncbi:MAG: AAA family ATPase [Alphaproteobacteria bacterium GM202ARS2]|nr:AAA family ATPase [Alphaproteobacteria bacterium GM202ARS2]
MDARFAIVSLTLMCFRNYEHLSLSFTPESVVFTGANGAGKTNLLEALSYLRVGRGLRGCEGDDVVHRRSPTQTKTLTPPYHKSVDLCGVFADVREPQGATRRSVEWRLEPPPPQSDTTDTAMQWRKSTRREGALDTHDDSLPMLWLVPGADRYSADSRAKRQLFFDQLISAQDKEHRRRLTRYDKTMRERTKVLRHHQGSWQERWLVTLEERMAQEALAIAAARKMFIASLNGALDAYSATDVQAHTHVQGTIEDQLDSFPALHVEESFCQQLKDNRRLDALKGRAEVGVHRSRFTVSDKRRGLDAQLCSTGQQKMLTLLVVLAGASLLGRKRAAPPIVLLDEVAAHLDSRHAQQFFQLLHGSQCQAWMTGLAPELFAASGPHIQGFDIEDGCVYPWKQPRQRSIRIAKA